MNLKINLVICLSVLLAISNVVRCDDEHADFEDAEGSVEQQPDVDAKPEVKREQVKYVKPEPKGVYHFLETFEEDSIGSKWIKSKAKKDGVDDSIAKYDGEWSIEPSADAVFEGDKGLVLKSKAKHHAISSKLSKPFLFSNKKPLIVQYEVKFQSPLECGGAYVKLLEDEPNLNLENFFDKTSFSIMFGPDKCGFETKYHFIVRFKHPVKGTFEEKHAKKSDLIDSYFKDGKTHLYTLIVEPDNTFKMLIDMKEVNSGSLLKDLSPPINPEKELVDPEDKKPESWDEREKIPDPDAVKPDDWDNNEPREIPDENAKMPEGWLEDEPDIVSDTSAVKPDDWDDATDGEWEAPKIDNPKCQSAPGCGKWKPPMIPNPKYRGEWKAPMIDNPSYQGIWEPRKIPNPDFFEDKEPFYSFVPFSAVGLELWSMTENIHFDNFIITDDKSVADQFAKDSWVLKKSLEVIGSEEKKEDQNEEPKDDHKDDHKDEL